MKVFRKCALCHEQIDLSKEHGQYIYEDSHFVHKECFTQKKKTLKRSPWSEQMVRDYFRIRQKPTDDYVRPIVVTAKNRVTAKERKAMYEKKKQQLSDWLLSSYHLMIPRSFYIKLDSIFDGSYKGLPQPIPPEHLLDMWRQKKSYLDKVAERNHRKGKDFDGSSRLNYDLAILLSKYNDYLLWRQKKDRELEASTPTKSELIPTSEVDYTKLYGSSGTRQTYTQNSVGGSEKLDINSILDEI